MFSKPKKLTSSPPIKAHVSLSHIKKQCGYDFPFYFPHKFLMNFRSNIKSSKVGNCHD